MFLHYSNTGCPGYNSSYVGKTNKTPFVRTQEHGSRTKKALSINIHAIASFSNIFKTYAIYQIFLFTRIFHLSNLMNKELFVRVVRRNTMILGNGNNYNLYKKAYLIVPNRTYHASLVEPWFRHGSYFGVT